MSVEEIKATVDRFIEAWNTGNLALLDETVSTDYVRHSPREDEDRHSLEELKQEVTRHRRDHPDLRLTLDDIVVEGNKVATRWHGTATDKATNKQVTLWRVNIGRIAGGKIVEEWEAWSRRGS